MCIKGSPGGKEYHISFSPLGETGKGVITFQELNILLLIAVVNINRQTLLPIYYIDFLP
jgi:hypothetical protein